MEPPSFSGSSRRAKAPGNNTQVAHCLVDGCCADLSLCRDYHRRHKVCEAHSKTPKVTIGGREQRFCQQCSRFHSLVEFDEGKRSCRKRLDGHNRRRRKPQPDSLPRNPGLVFSTQPGGVTGATLLSFTTPQSGRPSTTVSLQGGSTSWGGIVKAENDMVLYNNQHLLNFIDGQPNSFPEPSGVISQLHFDNSAIRDDVMSGSSSSDRALSLLSSAPTTTREFRSNHSVVQIEPPLPMSHSHPLVHNLGYGGGLGRYPFAHERKPIIDGTAAASDSHGGNNAAALHLQEMFQLGNEGSSTNGSHQTLTFSWE